MPGVPPGARDIEVTSLAYDNRANEARTLFFCIPGFTRDGHEFAPDAIRRGADALVVSNHGGRQLDGVVATLRILPEVVEAVGDRVAMMMVVKQPRVDIAVAKG